MWKHLLFNAKLNSICVLAPFSVAVLLSAGLAKADPASDLAAAKSEQGNAQKILQSAGCEPISNTNLSDGVTLKTLDGDILAALEKYMNGEEIDQVRVKTRDGHQFFFVQSESISYRCKKAADLPVVVLHHPIEPVTDVLLQFNPCCTYTYGGDALAQWFNLVNCPLSKPKKLANSVCGH